jgi:hypothetical protein
VRVWYCPTAEAASPRECQWPCRSALFASLAKGQAEGTRQMSNPQMSTPHSERSALGLRARLTSFTLRVTPREYLVNIC